MGDIIYLSKLLSITSFILSSTKSGSIAVSIYFFNSEESFPYLLTGFLQGLYVFFPGIREKTFECHYYEFSNEITGKPPKMKSPFFKKIMVLQRKRL